MDILFVNHKKSQCGIYELGVNQLLTKSYTNLHKLTEDYKKMLECI